jgi:hypothetical protein
VLFSPSIQSLISAELTLQSLPRISRGNKTKAKKLVGTEHQDEIISEREQEYRDSGRREPCTNPVGQFCFCLILTFHYQGLYSLKKVKSSHLSAKPENLDPNYISPKWLLRCFTLKLGVLPLQIA